MKTTNNITASHFLTTKNYLTIGTFDGVHIGHKKVLQTLIKNAKKENAKAILFTFFPHPRMVLNKESNIKLINTIEEKKTLLKKEGIDFTYVQEFNTEFSNLTALDFVKNILINTLHVKKLYMGYDHKFGKNREGTFKQLQEYGCKYNFEVFQISKKDINNIAVSSTKIRKAIEQGNIEKANKYLGYYFMLTGKVVDGKKLGQTINFPTANLHIKESHKLIPKTGVYVVKSIIEDVIYFGMMNIGYRPTVSGKNKTIEIHFFNLTKNLYEKTLQVDVLYFLRDEQKFNSVNELKDQLTLDKKNALAIIKKIN